MIRVPSKPWLAALALAGVLAGTAAHAGTNVYWSVGIQAPIHPGVTIGTVVSNLPAPVYVPAPVYAPAPVVVPAPVIVPAPVVYAPPVYVAPRPVYAQPRPVYVHPQPVYVAPRPVVIRPAPGVLPPGWKRHDHDRRWHRRGDEGRYGPVAYAEPRWGR